MRLAGESACPTTGKSFGCIGGTGFSLSMPACGRIFSHLLTSRLWSWSPCSPSRCEQERSTSSPWKLPADASGRTLRGSACLSLRPFMRAISRAPGSSLFDTGSRRACGHSMRCNWPWPSICCNWGRFPCSSRPTKDSAGSRRWLAVRQQIQSNQAGFWFEPYLSCHSPRSTPSTWGVISSHTRGATSASGNRPSFSPPAKLRRNRNNRSGDKILAVA